MQARKQAQPKQKAAQSKGGTKVKRGRKPVVSQVDELLKPVEAKAKQKNKTDIAAVRNHNFAKMIVSGFNSQLQWILENDSLLDEGTRNDLIALQFVVANALNTWHLKYLERKRQENEPEEIQKTNLYG